MVQIVGACQDFLDYKPELGELARLAQPLADAYMGAEVALGGFTPSSESRIPYEKVLECFEARSLYYNYLSFFFSGDMEKPYPELNDNECDWHESYFELFLSGLGK